MLKLIYPLLAVLVLIVLPLIAIYKRAKHGKSLKNPLYANLAASFAVSALCGIPSLSQGVAPANAAADAAATAAATGTDWTMAIGYLAAALAVGISGVGSAIAVSSTASAAIGAMVENEGTFGKSLVFVGLAEGIAIYGLLIAIVIVLL